MRQIQRVATLAILMAMLALVAPAFAAEEVKAPDEAAVKAALADLPTYEFGDSRAGLYLIETAVREAGSNRKAKRVMAKSLAGVLKSKSTNAAKDFACRQLAIIGGESQVDAIANLLPDTELSDIARYALERIPAPEAGKALRDALAKTKGKLKVGVISSLGVRAEADSVAPLKALLAALEEAHAAMPTAARIGAVGTTGSGRHLAGALLGSDVIKNEITAHAVGTLSWRPDIRTIIEIGGQDSKIIHLKNGMVADFAMNTVCAAGTGAFLDQQATRLQIPIQEFGDFAMGSETPVRIAGRCRGLTAQVRLGNDAVLGAQRPLPARPVAIQ